MSRRSLRSGFGPLHQGKRGVRRLGGSLLTVADVAKLLRVCTATVYSMVERGELEHVRVSNVIRIVVSGATNPEKGR